MNRKVLAVVLSLALFAGGVALGIHILHKKALAQVTYIVQIWDETQGELLDGADVDFSFEENPEEEDWLDTTPIGDGQYKYQVQDYKPYWWIRINEPEIVGDNPVEGPATVAFYFWEVETV